MTEELRKEVQLTQIEVLARRLLDNLLADVKNASSRAEHIRLTRLAIEAEELLSVVRNESTLYEKE